MVGQLGAPSLLLTLTAADNHWPDLFKILDPNCDIAGMNELLANRARQQLLNENPYVAAQFFQE